MYIFIGGVLLVISIVGFIFAWEGFQINKRRQIKRPTFCDPQNLNDSGIFVKHGMVDDGHGTVFSQSTPSKTFYRK